ncbi:MAG: insulinase family protein [Myxococcales bacterium]|nr:insulinase family protein [Myxococcales bacterium]
MNSRFLLSLAFLLSATAFVACGGAPQQGPSTPTGESDGQGNDLTEAPPSGPARDVSFPPVTRTTLPSGLEIHAVEMHQLPVVYFRLVVRSGGETDPEDIPGLSDLVASMLKEGTKNRTSAQIAEEIEFLGADISTGSGMENLYLSGRTLTTHLDATLDLLADIVLHPTFPQDELKKLIKREENELALQENQPRFLGYRELYGALYGTHPYGRISTTRDALKKASRARLQKWHKQHFVPGNATLVVVGDITPAAVEGKVKELFGPWTGGAVTAPAYPTPPSRDGREIILVDRPESDQSMIYIGNLALPRGSEDYIPLLVANQVLGGSATSRLFMDLREKRSLTYGAYSGIGEMVDTAPFYASAQVRTEVTGEALGAFFEHLDRIVTEAAPPAELSDAKRFLTDQFPLQIDTPAPIARMVSDLRIFGLPQDYWDGYRSAIGQVDAAGALRAAKTYIHPDQAVVVVVGKATAILGDLRTLGPVRVVDKKGKTQGEFTQLPEGGKAEEKPAH